MNKHFHILFVCLLPVFCIAQSDTKKYDNSQNMEVALNQDAHYVDGDQALFEYIYKNVQYPDKAKGKALKGEILLSFNVETDSTLSDVSIISGVGYGADEEVKRLIESLKFAPSIQNGMKVKMNLMLSVPVSIK